LLEYFGEEDKSMQPHDLFSTMVTFCRDFDKAKEEVFAMEKKKQREERKRQAGRPPTHSPAPPTEKKRQPMLRASSHQPNFSDAMRNSDRQPRQPAVNSVPEQTASSSPHYQSSTRDTRHAYERSYSAPLESQDHQNHAYSRSSSMQDQEHPPIQQQREMSHHSSYTVGTSQPSSPSHAGTQSAAARLKAKARMQQRNSPPSSSPSQVEYQHYPTSNQHSPARLVSSPSNQSTDSGRSAARSSFRERRRQEVRERIRQAASRE
jgi:hypothetical protein